jgi:hypothetical protein
MPSGSIEELFGEAGAGEAAQEAGKQAAQGEFINIQELIEFKKAEKELQELMLEGEEESGGGLGEGIGEAIKAIAKDDDMKNLLKQYMQNGGSVMSNPEGLEGVNAQEHPDSNDPYENGENGGSGVPEGHYPMSPADVHAVMYSALNDLSNLKPDMTMEEAVTHAQENEEMIIGEIEGMLEEAYEGEDND